LPTRYRTEVVEQWFLPNWESVLGGHLLPPTKLTDSNVQQGVSEAKFRTYLEKYFGDILKSSYSFSIPNTDLFYSPDFALVRNCSGLKKVEVFGLERKSQVGWGEVAREIGSKR
jgi:hypothetical protein